MLGVVNEKALHELGWPRLCAELGARARTPMGRDRCVSLLPGDDPDAARRHLGLVEEARLLHRHERELPLADAVDVRPSLGRAAREGTLEPPELLQVARLIRASDSARSFCFSQADRAPLHFELAQQLSELAPLAPALEPACGPGERGRSSARSRASGSSTGRPPGGGWATTLRPAPPNWAEIASTCARCGTRCSCCSASPAAWWRTTSRYSRRRRP